MSIIQKFFCIFFTLFLFFSGFSVFAESYLDAADSREISQKLDIVEKSVNSGNVQIITQLISPDNQSLQINIREGIKGSVPYVLQYEPLDMHMEINDKNQVLVSAMSSASGVNWTINSRPVHFLFEKIDNQWIILDTDFHTVLRPENISFVVSYQQAYLLLVLVGMIFMWIWMLIDCLFRNFDNKLAWLVFLLFFSPIALLLYFIKIKRGDINNNPLIFKI